VVPDDSADSPLPSATRPPTTGRGAPAVSADLEAFPDAAEIEAPAQAPAAVNSEPATGSTPPAADSAIQPVEPAVVSIDPQATTAPVMTAASPSVVSQPGKVNGLGSGLLSWLGASGNGDAPAAAPLMWTMAAVSRRELGAPSSNAKPAPATTTGEPAEPVALTTVLATPQASSTGGLTADPFADFIRIFIGDGTATNPNAGLLIGNGYSWTAETCNQGAACNGGQAGLLFGNGGNGWSGGNGGSAGLFGAGGAGGSGLAAVNRGVGGSGPESGKN
jgi:hypothetical protein